MTIPLLVDSTDLDKWADRLDAQSELPRLTRRLIHGTSKDLIKISFPSGEGVQLRGWDGVVLVEKGNAFIPEGLSAWELSVRKDIGTKASADYNSRTEDPKELIPSETTFVFVTPRRWPGKHDWVANCKKDEVWKDVRAYDSEDLSNWLEITHAVHIWFSRLLGKYPNGVMDFESYWAEWVNFTDPPISADLLLSGRETLIDEVSNWLLSGDSSLSLQSESRLEAFGIFGAALQLSVISNIQSYINRTIVVLEKNAWSSITISGSKLILIPLFDDLSNLAGITSYEHRCVFPLGCSDIVATHITKAHRISRTSAFENLCELGVEEERAHELSAILRRNFSSFRRRIAVNPELQQPVWSQPEIGPTLIPMLLVGKWDDALEGDRGVLSTIARTDYDNLRSEIVRWSKEDDAPLRHVGTTWMLVSREDSWALLLQYLSIADMELFSDVAIGVLSAIHPKFELPLEKRWAAAVYGKVSPYSEYLIDGISETLPVLSIFHQQLNVRPDLQTERFADHIISSVLRAANREWQIWASLSPYLYLFAEACPDTFCAAVEAGLDGKDPILSNLFTDEDNSFMGPAYYSGLLRALGIIAWLPDYLARAALALAGLAKISPTGRGGNRPLNILREIFLSWNPQTAATAEHRISVIDLIREREPEIAWKLLVELLPKHHDVGGITEKPRWRELEFNIKDRDIYSERISTIQELVHRMLDDVGDHGERWFSLIESLPTLPMNLFESAAEKLNALSIDAISIEDRNVISNSLRALISRHRTFPDAAWALPSSYVDKLDESLKTFESGNVIERYRWLFDLSPTMPEGHDRDWQQHQEELLTRRIKALEEVVRTSGWEGIDQLLRTVEQPRYLGLSIGQVDIINEAEFLPDFLSSEDSKEREFSIGYVCGRVVVRGKQWAEEKLIKVAESWSPIQKATALTCLQFDADTLKLLDRLGEETKKTYWMHVKHQSLDENVVEVAVENLINVGRPYSALDVLAMSSHRKDLSSQLIVSALETALGVSIVDDPPMSTIGYNITELISLLEPSDDLSEGQIARIEWAHIHVIKRNNGSLRYLHRELAINPEFFVEILSIVYRAEDDEPSEVTEAAQSAARHGYELLDSWRSLPGRDQSGEINPDKFWDWMRNAREGYFKIGRGSIGDTVLGQVISGSPAGLDGIWPIEFVRDFIEDSKSGDFESGIHIGVSNSRGVISRSPLEGGEQERGIAKRYEDFASSINDKWPRTASLLRRISREFLAMADREDQEAELREDLSR